MIESDSRMRAEIGEAPGAVERQEAVLAAPLADLVAQLKRRPPGVVITCARGSSAHAATFGKHLIERYVRLPVAEAAPNIASVYNQRLRLDNHLILAISQSGRSDDLIKFSSYGRESGALTVAIT